MVRGCLGTFARMYGRQRVMLWGWIRWMTPPRMSHPKPQLLERQRSLRCSRQMRLFVQRLPRSGWQIKRITRRFR